MSCVIVWLRQDIRLHDNPALHHAIQTGLPVLCIYIDDNVTPCRVDEQGAALRLWMNHALKSFTKDLTIIGGKISYFQGNPLDILQKLATETGASHIFWNRLYTPYATKRDSEIKSMLKELSLQVKSFAGQLLFEPHQIKNKQGDIYKVYTPFRKACETYGIPFAVAPEVTQIDGFTGHYSDNKTIDEIFPLPTRPDWGSSMVAGWDISEQGALTLLEQFIKSAIETYKTERDFPAKKGVSRLSPYLARGFISPFTIMNRLQNVPESAGKTHFISELLWREFASYLLFHFPYMQQSNFRPEWDDFIWENREDYLQAWQKGQTGYPLIDAAMQELWQTGYMHNRTRMLVGSFLVKHLLVDWKHGEAWFRDCLFDFDVANNIASWQWVAGSGADAAPYFRIFNPCLQSEKFDADGTYIKTYLPVLQNVPASCLHQFHLVPESELWLYGIRLKQNYPAPLISLEQGKNKAMQHYEALRDKQKKSS